MSVDASVEDGVHCVMAAGLCRGNAMLDRLGSSIRSVVQRISEDRECQGVDFGWLKSVKHGIREDHAEYKSADKSLVELRFGVEVDRAHRQYVSRHGVEVCAVEFEIHSACSQFFIAKSYSTSRP